LRGSVSYGLDLKSAPGNYCLYKPLSHSPSFFGISSNGGNKYAAIIARRKISEHAILP